MCGLIEANVQSLKIDDKEIEIVTAEASRFVALNAKKGAQPFDIIFFDPPYAADYESVIRYIGDHRELLVDDGVIIVEHHKKKELPEEIGMLRRYRALNQGDSALGFYRATKSVPSA